MIKRIMALFYRILNLCNDKGVNGNKNLWAIVKLCTSFGKLQQASAALTYHTLFAIVPVMALMVAIAKILGYGEIFKEQVQLFFHGQDIISDKLLGFADSYLDNTQVSFGWVPVSDLFCCSIRCSPFSALSTAPSTRCGTCPGAISPSS